MKKYVSILLVLAGVVAFLAYYMIFSAPAPKVSEMADEKEVSRESEPKKPKQEPFSGAGTLQGLQLRGEDIECTVSYAQSGVEKEIEGTFFVSQGNLRGDFLVPSPDLTGEILSSVIMDKDNLYTWTEIEGQAYGAKIALSIMDSEQTDANLPVSLETEVNYDCKPWQNVDTSVFIPPGKVLFKDISELQKAGMEYGTTYEAETLPVQ